MMAIQISWLLVQTGQAGTSECIDPMKVSRMLWPVVWMTVDRSEEVLMPGLSVLHVCWQGRCAGGLGPL